MPPAAATSTPFWTVPLAPTLTVVAVPDRTPLLCRVIGAFRLAVAALRVRSPGTVLVLPLASMASSTVMALVAVRVTLVVFRASTTVLAAIVLSVVELSPAPSMAPVPVVPTVRFSGSSNQVPNLPWGALVLTPAALPTTKLVLPDVSTKPPLPPAVPPWALILPSNRVVPSAHTMTRPPLPLLVASAVITLLASTLVTAARGVVPCP